MSYYTPQQLLQTFNDWEIPVSTIEHEPLFTSQDCHDVVYQLPGGHCKSLFLKNKKKQLYLVVMLQEDQLDITALSAQLGGGRLSFCTAEQLYDKLGLTPGSVTPFGMINPTSRDVTLILEQRMMDHEILNYHPLINTMTTAIAKNDLLIFLERCGHMPKVMDLPLKTTG